jgi:hypothetical protein
LGKRAASSRLHQSVFGIPNQGAITRRAGVVAVGIVLGGGRTGGCAGIIGVRVKLNLSVKLILL